MTLTGRSTPLILKFENLYRLDPSSSIGIVTFARKRHSDGK